MKFRTSAWIVGSAVAATIGMAACESTKTAPSNASKPAAQGAAKEPEAKSGEAQKPESRSVVMEQDEDEPAHDGLWLYTHNCEGCHNKNGDGQGPTIVAMGQKARSFAQGGFAFGNTREAIYKTITAGMPGSSVMPSFKATLNDDERWLLADYVLTLCPKAEEAAHGTAMKVEKDPAVARGLLPPIVDKKPEWPRGLLIGFPEGMTFEYRTDDVRLLAVRQGEFADREDWNDRGGSPLVPLGKTIYVPGDGDPPPTVAIVHAGTYKPTTTRLKKTWNRHDSAGLAYEVRDKEDAVIANVSESLHVEAMSIGGAFTRNFELTAGTEASTLVVTVAGPTENTEWVRGMSGKWKPDTELERAPVPADGWIVARQGDAFQCIHIEAPASVQLIRDANRVRLLVPVYVDKDGARAPSKIKVTFVMSHEWTPKQLAELAKEIAR